MKEKPNYSGQLSVLLKHIQEGFKECPVLSRQACISFMDLCKKKNEDALWMDEIAAMQAFSQPELPYIATSGIILAGEDNDPIGKQIGSADGSVSDTNHGMKYE